MSLRFLIPVLLAAALPGVVAMERPPAAKPVSSATPAPSALPAVAFPTPPAPLTIPADTRAFKDAPDALGITVEGGESDADDDNSVTATTEFTIQFPDAMVAPDRIDVEDSQSPVVLWPDLSAKWIWRTQSQGVWSVNGPLIPGQAYRMRLRDGLKNLAGESLDTAAWGYEIATSPLTVSSDWDERDQLSAQPQVPLEFDFPVRLHDAAAGIWVQDRASRERFPVEVLLNRAVSDVTGDAVDVTNVAELPAPKEFRVRPRAPLPVGHFYDLVVEDVHDAYAGRTLPYPEVFSLGSTRPLGVDYVAARNWTQDKPFIEVKFTAPLGDASLPADALIIEPSVANLKFEKEGETIDATGNFDTSVRYKVTISDKIEGDRGYTLPKPSIWGATFHPKEATLMFPEGTIRQRSALGLRFALLQANTGPVTWRLARIPLERLAEAQLAMKNDAKVLVDSLHLEVVAQGDLPASMNDHDELRAISWKPADGAPPLSGPYLMEATTKDGKGATLSNDALVFFNEAVFTQKTMPSGTELRLADMGDAKPLAGVTVRVISAALTEIARSTTDANGVIFFPASAVVGAAFFAADTPGAPSIELTTPGSSFANTGSSYATAPAPFLGGIITDRPLYRPGEEVKFKGFLRTNADGRLTPPTGATVAWEIIHSDDDQRVAEGTARVNSFGGWDGAWTAPPQGKLGDFRIAAKVGETGAGSNGSFRVDEFRNPPFSVICEPEPQTKASESTLDVSSEYFHGAPNVGSRVKWTATWLSDSDGEYYSDEDANGFQCVDLYSEHRRTPAFEMEVSGETALDAKGRATLTSAAPFKDPGLRARCQVLWRVDVTGPDGQTITGGADAKVVMNDVTLGVKADRDTGVKDIAFELSSIPRDSAQPAPAEVHADLFLVQTKSVKERLAPFVYRYRNTDEFVPIEQKNVPANGRLDFTPKTPGRYVLVVSALPGQPGITVSDEIYLSGDGEAQVPVSNDQTLTIQPVAKDKPVPVGEKAAFDVLAPSPGIAWVTIETDRVLDTFTLPIDGNSSRIEVPVKPGYAPNVHVSAYLLRPGHTDELPGEMFGTCELKVSQPDALLALAVSTDKPEYKPRQDGAITVRATATGKPVANAEVTLYAVDDSILTLGGWALPTLLDTFFPEHPFNVVTRLALTGYVESFKPESLTQKGFVVGGGGKDDYGNSEFVRQNFRPRILWLPSLKTNADGVATAPFTTPDNLTRFRVIALAQTTANQFGSGDSTFTVSKPVIVEPALPRFLRQGDEIELRAVARQKVAPEDKLTITCKPGAGLTLTGPATIERSATKNEPAVATFRARVSDPATSAMVHFSVSSASGNDEVEVTLPVVLKTILVPESVAGDWTGPTFEPTKHEPAEWQGAPGECQVTLSTSPYLTKLLGIPAVLDYPHGCFEQKSSRLLVYTALAKLLAYLPQPAERTENYRRVIEETLKEFDKSILPDDTLPYWPYGTTGNAFVTIQSAWAVAQAVQAGLEVPQGLTDALPHALNQMVLRKSRLEVDPTLRAFAICVLSQLQDEADDDLTAAANELFLGRDRLTDEGRAMLAIALHTWNLEPEHQQELIREIPEKFDPRTFNPVTFSSTTRAEAICTWARLLVTPDANPQQLKARLEALMQNSSNLSTQENLWTLIAFNALLSQKPPAKLAPALAPKPAAISENQSAATWGPLELARLRDLTIRNLGKSGAWVLAAHRALTPAEQKPVAKGLRIERIVKNLTAPERTGTPDKPFQLGDQVLISFRFHCDQAQSYVAVEDALPAGLEVLNPNLEMIGKFYQIPDEPGVPAAWLSFSEMRDTQTNLYFDILPAGSNSYAVLARATAAGTFAWPSAQIAPMYDSRFYARTAPSTCVVASP